MDIFREINDSIISTSYEFSPRDYSFKARVGYPSRYYKFGTVSGELPNYIIDLFNQYRVSYFNLTSGQRVHQTIFLDQIECHNLAALFSNFVESPLSLFRNCAIHELEEQFTYRTSRRKQERILVEYFDYDNTIKTTLDQHSYSCKTPLELFFENLEDCSYSLDIILKILDEEYDVDVTNLTNGKNSALVPRTVGGVPSFTTKDGKIFNIALKKEEESVLVLNKTREYSPTIKEYVCNNSVIPTLCVLSSEELKQSKNFQLS